MFVLREINYKGGDYNTIIGDTYSIVSKDIDPENFEKLREKYEEARGDTGVIGFVSCDRIHSGCKIIPLFMKAKYFIMTSGGGTFETLDRLL